MDKQELAQLCVRRIDRMAEAVRQGEADEALRWAREALEGKKAFHDFAVRWVNLLLGRLRDALGDEGVREAHEEFAATFVPPVVRRWQEAYERGEATPESFPLEDFIRQRAEMWDLTHDNRFTLEEDDEKFVLRLDPCESGGRLLMDWGDRLARVREAHRWTYNRKDFPCYCGHCSVMWEFGWYERYGYPLIVFFPPEKPGDPCVQHFYKRPDLIPASYWQRVGLEPRFRR